MIISNSQVGMSSKRSYAASSYSYSHLQSWDNSGVKNVTQISNDNNGASTTLGEKGTPNFSGSMDDMLKKYMEAKEIRNETINDRQQNLKVTFASLNYLFHWLFGKKFDPSEYDLPNFFDHLNARNQEPGGSFEFNAGFYEMESTTFSTTGTVRCEDGREISFNLNLSMTREFQETYHAAASWGAALNQAELCDPLVINLKGSVSNLTDQTFVFDIDADGQTENIKMPTNGSGFLALDKNGDGIINDGSELFGTQSQNGFADLAAYDEDGNGWIDEADSVFKRLLVYSKDSSGNDKLISIAEAGVGAIYLGNADTEFSKTNMGNNQVDAVVRRTGIFLYENGGAGTIQHVDFAKQA